MRVNYFITFSLIILITMFAFINACNVREENCSDYSYNECVNKAKEYIANGKIEKAINLYKGALGIKPNDSNTHYKLGNLYYRKWEQSFNLARRKYISNSIKHPKSNSFSSLDEVDTELEQKLQKYGLEVKFKKMAMERFTDATRMSPDLWQAQYLLGVDALNNGEYLFAIEKMKLVAKYNSEYIVAYSVAAESLKKLKEYEKAIMWLEEAMALSSGDDYEFILYKIGITYREMGEGHKAKEIYMKLRDMDSSYYELFRMSIYEGD